MSVKQMALVWELNLPHNQAWVLMAYADHADHDGGHVYPSVGLIAWKTGYSERQVQRIIKDLEAEGLMVAVKYRMGGRSVFPLYRLNLEKGVKKSPFQRGDISERVTSEAVKGDILAEKGDIAMAPEPSLEPSKIRKIRARARREEKTKDADETTEDPLAQQWQEHLQRQQAHQAPNPPNAIPIRHVDVWGDTDSPERVAAAAERKAQMRAAYEASTTGGN